MDVCGAGEGGGTSIRSLDHQLVFRLDRALQLLGHRDDTQFPVDGESISDVSCNTNGGDQLSAETGQSERTISRDNLKDLKGQSERTTAKDNSKGQSTEQTKTVCTVHKGKPHIYQFQLPIPN